MAARETFFFFNWRHSGQSPIPRATEEMLKVVLEERFSICASFLLPLMERTGWKCSVLEKFSPKIRGLFLFDKKGLS